MRPRTARARAHHPARHVARPTALLLALVRRARWLWLDGFEARWTALRERVRAWRAARWAAVAERPQFETLEPKLLLSADLMPLDHAVPQSVVRQIEVATPSSALETANMERAMAVASVAPTVTVTGPGTGALVAQGGGYLLQLSGTTAATGVSLGSANQVLLTGITANSAVGTLNLANADLQGQASFAAGVAGLTLGQVRQSTVSVVGGTDFVFKAGAISDSRVSAPTANVATSVASWTGSSRLESAGLKTLTVTGDMTAEVFLSGMSTGYTLGAVQVGSAIGGGLWSIHGRANSISAGSTAAAWRMNISSTLVQLVVKGDASGDIALAGLQLLQVGGSVRGLHLLVGANLGDDAALGGSGANADSFQAGTLARLRIGGDLIDSSIFISVDPVNGVFGDGNDRQLGKAVQRLQEVTVGGQLLGSSRVIAPMFPTTVKVGGVNVDPATLPQFGSVPPDTVAPVLVSFGLDPSSDTGVVGDNRTTANIVALVGITEAGAALSLRRSGSSTVVASTTAGTDGSFHFSGLALALGANGFDLSVADAARNTTSGSLSITREVPPDTLAPTLIAALVNDTGVNGNDGVTSDPRIGGIATDDVGVVLLQAALDVSGSAVFSDVTASLGTGGTFTLSAAQLATLAGGTLAQGAHTLRLRASDAAGNPTTVDVAFTLDTQAPAIAAFVLAAGSDTGTLGDNTTSANPVALSGTAEAGASLVLRAAGSAGVLGTATAAVDGSYNFAGIALTLGANAFELTATDRAGNTALAALTVTRQAAGATDTTPPTLSAALVNDTGMSSSDGLTNDPMIAGQALDDTAAMRLLAALDGGGSPTFVDLSTRLQADGRFTINKAALDALAGGTLGNGAHTLRLVAQDAAGNSSSPLDVVFTFDNQAPTGASFGIASVDALAGNDAQTGAGVVTLQGTAEAGATVTLVSQGLLSTASGAGSFQLPNVALATGDNSITLTVTDAAGNSQTVTRTLTRVQTTQSDAVLDWVSIALNSIQLDVTDPPIATRVLALQSIAVYDALAAIQGTPAFLVQQSISGSVDAQAAAAEAAYRVLYQLSPAQRAALDAKLVTSLS